MFIAKITEVQRDRFIIRVNINFSNELGESFDELVSIGPNSTLDEIKEYAQKRIKETQSTLDFSKTLPIGEELSPPIPKSPSPEEIQKGELLEKYAQFVRLKKAVDLGIIEEATLSVLKGELNSLDASWL